MGIVTRIGRRKGAPPSRPRSSGKRAPAAPEPAPKPKLKRGETECPECHAISTKSREMHEDYCTRSAAASAERGEGFRAVEVDGQPALLIEGKQVPLVELTDEQLDEILADQWDIVAEREREHKRTGEKLKKARDNFDYAAKQLRDRVRARKGQTRLDF